VRRTTRLAIAFWHGIERLFGASGPDRLTVAEEAHLHRVSERARTAIEHGEKILRSSV
jgi:hypothetical protein